VTTLENEHMRSFLREEVVVLMYQGGALLVMLRMGVGGEQQPVGSSEIVSKYILLVISKENVPC